jgi:phosphoribosylamine-glycine ligase
VVAKNGTSNVISNKINLYLFGMEATAYGIPATYVDGSMNYDIAVLRVENSAVLKEAIAASYAKVEKIHFDNKYYRHDIGQRALDANKE